MRSCLPALALALLAAPAFAQEPAPVYQQQQSGGFQFKADAFARREWTQDVVTSTATDPLSTEDQSRWVFRLRPRVELGGQRFKLGVGGDFYYSNKDNLVPPAGATSLALIRDNFDSRSARLDLAFAQIEPVSWLRLEAGRFAMPVPFTELIWDRDLRPQGAAATLSTRNHGSLQSASVTGLIARGSHVFDDGKDFFDDASVELKLISGQLNLQASESTTIQLVGSYLQFDRVGGLEAKIRRQNTRIAGQIVRDYRVFDAVARLQTGGNLPVQLIANMCWNVAKDPTPDVLAPIAFPHGKKGVWLAAVLGSLDKARARAEYTYASVDRDATLAAYTADDFFWGSGWQGHRAELATSGGHRSSIHLIGQLQRFKDSPSVAERDHWVKRLRIELRASY